MPIFWRYLLSQYFKVLFLVVVSFIAIMVVSRLEEIAQFAALGARGKYLFLFTLYQIPYILPIALPISSLISAMILLQRLSHAHEFTALRVSGLSSSKILAPLLIASAFLGLLNFYITSELATTSHLKTRKMAYEISALNPLILLQNAKVAKLKGGYVQMDPLRNGEAAENLLISFYHQPNERLNLLLAKKAAVAQSNLILSDVTLVSSMQSQEPKGFDHLLIENQKEATSHALEFATLMRGKGWKIANDHLNLSLLRARLHDLKENLKSAAKGKKRSFFQKNIQKCYCECVRRVSFALAAFTFPLVGIAFGMEISRTPSKKGVIAVLLLAAFSLISFFIAKEFDHRLFLASLLLLLPHLFLALSSLWMFRRVNQGIE